MLKRVLFWSVIFLLAFVVFFRAEEQKKLPETQGLITIDTPELKKNMNLPEAPVKSAPAIKIQPPRQNTVTKVIGTDIEMVFPSKPKLNFQGKYYIPAEDTTEWYDEAVKNNRQGIRWDDFCDDLFIVRPGDTWYDFPKVFNFQLAATVSSLAFVGFTQNSGSKSEGRLKSLVFTTALVTVIELLNSTNPKQHFCAKNLAAGVTGSLFGSYILTAGFGF